MSFGTLGQPAYGTIETSEADTIAWQTDDESGSISLRTEGLAYVAFLVINGPLTIRNLRAVAEIITTEPGTGGTIVAIIVQEDGATVESAATQIDAQAGIRAAVITPGIVLIEIPAGGVATAMLANLAVTASKIAAATITADKLAEDYVTNRARQHAYAYRSTTRGVGAINVVSVGGANIFDEAIILPNDGETYEFEISVGAALNAPSGQEIEIAAVMADAGGMPLHAADWIGTGTVGGERWVQTFDRPPGIVASGQTVRAQLRARVTGGTGSVGSATLRAYATNR